MPKKQSLCLKVQELIAQKLLPLGFKKHQQGVLTLQIEPELLCWVGLNTATARTANGATLEVNTVIGVRQQAVERLVAKLNEEEFNEIIPPTIAGNIGYLSTEDKYLPYYFPAGADPNPIVESLCEKIAATAIPFARKSRDMYALISEMETSRFSMPTQIAYRIAAAYIIVGNLKKAGELVTARLEKLQQQADPGAVRYKKFANKILEITGVER